MSTTSEEDVAAEKESGADRTGSKKGRFSVKFADGAEDAEIASPTGAHEPPFPSGAFLPSLHALH